MLSLFRRAWNPAALIRHLFSGEFLAIGVFCVYLFTAAPGVWGFDSAELATGAHTLGIVHPPGYPLYLLLAKGFTLLVPVRDVAYRLNLLSAVFAALTIYFLYRLIARLTKDHVVAWSSAGLFAFSNYFWQMALVAEVYTLHTLFLVLCLTLLLRTIETHQARWAYLFAWVYGLSLCNHTSGILFAIGFGWILIAHGFLGKDWLRKSLLAGVCFLAGLLPYVYFPIRAQSSLIINYPYQYYDVDISTLQGVWWMVSGQAYRFFQFAYELRELPVEVYQYLSFLWRNFLGFGVLVGILGLVLLWRKNWKLGLGLALIFLANVVFFIGYRVVDKDTMFLPSYLIFTVFISYGLLGMLEGVQGFIRRYRLRFNPRVYILILLGLIPLSSLGLNWRWVDMHNMDSPQVFAHQVFMNVSRDAMILGDWSSAVILEYFQIVQGERQDLMIYNRSRTSVASFYANWKNGMPYAVNQAAIRQEELEMIEANIDLRPVYMVEYEADYEGMFRFVPEGNYFRLEREQP